MEAFLNAFYKNFIKDDRWKYITNGLGVTLKVTFFAVLIGIVLGFLVGIIRSTHERTGKFRLLNAICKVYLTAVSYTHLGKIYREALWGRHRYRRADPQPGDGGYPG